MSSTRGWTAVPVCLAAVVATIGVAPPARAELTGGSLSVDQFVYDGGFDCDVVGNRPNPSTVEWRDDGATATQRHTVAATSVPASNIADVTELASSVDSWVRGTPMNGTPATVTGAMAVRAAATSRLPTSVCREARAKASSVLSAYGNLTRPIWATITATGEGAGYAYGSISIDTDLGQTGVDVTPRSRGSVTVLLPAGGVGFWIDATADSTAKDRAPAALDMAFTITFLPPGHPSTPTGRGSAYVALGARSCADGSIATEVTRKAARKARRVVVSVNGVRVLAAKGNKVRKRSLILPAAPRDAAEVAVRVVTRKGRTLEATRRYEACS